MMYIYIYTDHNSHGVGEISDGFLFFIYIHICISIYMHTYKYTEHISNSPVSLEDTMRDDICIHTHTCAYRCRYRYRYRYRHRYTHMQNISAIEFASWATQISSVTAGDNMGDSIYIYTYIYTHTYMYTCIYVYTHTSNSVGEISDTDFISLVVGEIRDTDLIKSHRETTLATLHIYTYIYIHIHIHMYMYTYTHIPAVVV